MKASQNDSPGAHNALSRLCATYWFPLYAFIRRQGYAPSEAEDLTQGFFERLLEKGYLAGVKPEAGRFRSFLLASLKHFLSNERERARAQKRGGGHKVISLEGESPESRYLLEPADDLSPEVLFEQRWARTVLEQALAHLQTEYNEAGKADLFRELKGFLSGDKALIPRTEIAARHGISVNAVDMAIHRLRQRYGRALREQIAQTVSSPAEVEDEIRYLIKMLGHS